MKCTLLNLMSNHCLQVSSLCSWHCGLCLHTSNSFSYTIELVFITLIHDWIMAESLYLSISIYKCNASHQRNHSCTLHEYRYINVYNYTHCFCYHHLYTHLCIYVTVYTVSCFTTSLWVYCPYLFPVSAMRALLTWTITYLADEVNSDGDSLSLMYLCDVIFLSQ